MKNTRKKNRNKAKSKTMKTMKGGGIFDYFSSVEAEIPVTSPVNRIEDDNDKKDVSYKDKALNAATGAFDMLKSGFSGLTSGITSLGHFFVHDPNAVPKPKLLPKTEVYMGTETTDYKHPLDGTNVGQINVYKKNNSANVDSIKSVDNFISRVQEELLNSSEKDPLQVKTPEQLFKNKDTEKRLAVFHPLSDKTDTGEAKKGGKIKRKTRKQKTVKMQNCKKNK
jgi:hypothetical protein